MLLISGGLGLGSVTKNEVVWVSNNPQHIQKRGHSTYHCLNKKKNRFYATNQVYCSRPTKTRKWNSKLPRIYYSRPTNQMEKQRWKKKRGVALTPSAASPISGWTLSSTAIPSFAAEIFRF